MRKFVVVALVTFCFLIVLIQFDYDKSPYRRVINKFLYDKSLLCYYMKPPDTLPEILEVQPAKNRSIFFHETSCRSYVNGKITITARQACAVESAARQNPNFEVYLLFLSPAPFIYEGDESDRFLKALLSYKNVKFYYLNFEKYFKGTIVENLLDQHKLYNSSFPQIHASDILRYLTLWRYGGIYLDLDVIVLKSLENLNLNFAGYESREVATGVLSFASAGDGHKFSTLCLQDLYDNFQGSLWSHNSNGVLGRVMAKHCVRKRVGNRISKDCLANFTVHPMNAFYSIPWQEWYKYFNSTWLQEVEQRSKDSYLIHVWNKLSYNQTIPIKDTNVPYVAFAQKYCPKVFSQCETFF